MAFEKLCSPIKIGNMELKNRTVLMAMGRPIADFDSSPNEKTFNYIVNFAKNHVGLIIPGYFQVRDDEIHQSSLSMSLYDDKFIPELKKMTDAVHKYGSKIAFQINYPGLVTYGGERLPAKGPDDYTVEEIKDFEIAYMQAGIRAKEAGADAVEFHLAHNYLAESFLAPCFNHRTDEYGADTVENGLRFSLECIALLRNALGEDYPIIAKINAFDRLENGLTPERMVAAGKMLEEAGISMITVSAGGMISGVTDMAGDGTRTEGWKVPFAEMLRKEVSIPVCASGSIRHPDFAEKILEEGKCDLIGMGRTFTADPEWMVKVEENRVDEIRYCISCMSCISLYPAGEAGCSVNPLNCREFQKNELKKDGNGRLVAIVGAGPAGLEAAVNFAKRGFKPVVFEAKNQIGGMERISSLPDAKSKTAWHIDYYQRMINKLCIDVRLNTTATPEMLKNLNPYATVIATGAEQVVPAGLPGINLPHVKIGTEFLDSGERFTNHNVVVVGAGLVGLEIAHTLAAAKNHVTVIDMALVHPDSMTTQLNYPLTKGYCEMNGAEIKMGHKLQSISTSEVTAEDITTGETVIIPATDVILCMGSKSRTALYDEVKNILPNVTLIGDSIKVARIRNAVQAGYDVALNPEHDVYPASRIMKAAVMNDYSGKTSIEEIEIDAPASHEVLVKLIATGICGTDLGSRTTPLAKPNILGHEGAGIVEQVGPDVTDLKKGDHVILTYPTCGKCPMCSTGRSYACSNLTALAFYGHMPDMTTRLHNRKHQEVYNFFAQSSFAEYAVVMDTAAIKIDKDIDHTVLGPLGCGYMTGAGAVLNAANAQAEDTIAIFGCGSVGFSALMAAKIRNCKTIIAVSGSEEKLLLAKELGATHIVNRSKVKDAVSEIRKITGGLGVNYAVDTTGSQPMIDLEQSALANGGKHIIVSTFSTLTFKTAEMLMKGQQIVIVTEGNDDSHKLIPELIEYYKEGKFPVEKLATFYDLDDIEQAYEDLAAHKIIKPILRMSK